MNSLEVGGGALEKDAFPTCRKKVETELQKLVYAKTQII
jgi:hypothetical protein